jgi:hypothetical protein
MPFAFITTNKAFSEARAKIAATDSDYAVKSKYVADSLQLALETIESYLDRKLEYGPETETIDAGISKTNWRLKRYPIDTIDTVSTGTIGDYYVNKAIGVVMGTIHGDAKTGFTMTYKGGFKTIPQEIENVIWQMFDRIYVSKVNNATVDLNEDGMSGLSVKSVAVPDVGTITLQADVLNTNSTHVIPAENYGFIDPMMAQALSRYRASSICGVG